MARELTKNTSNGQDAGIYSSQKILEQRDEFRLYTSDTIDHKALGLGTDTLLDMYENMLLQRRFEERASQMYGKQKIGGFLHLYIGQEAISTGTANAINIGQDSVITAYRDHGIGLALGMSPNECMAELFGRSGGSSKGKGGSMHYFSKDYGLFGGHGIVGAHVPLGVGIAFAHKYKGDGGVCIVFLGDGAVGQGAFHEACNLAGVYQLPVVIVVENNQYAMGTAVHRVFAETDFYRHAPGIRHARRPGQRNERARRLRRNKGLCRDGPQQRTKFARNSHVPVPRTFNVGSTKVPDEGRDGCEEE